MWLVRNIKNLHQLKDILVMIKPQEANIDNILLSLDPNVITCMGCGKKYNILEQKEYLLQYLRSPVVPMNLRCIECFCDHYDMYVTSHWFKDSLPRIIPTEVHKKIMK